MTLFLIALLAGVLTTLAPCILPLLPVIVGGSLADGRVNYRKALTVVVSLGLSVIAFTFILKVSTAFIGIPESVWQYISGGIILIFGFFTLFPDLYEKIPIVNALNRKSNMAMSAGYREKSFLGDALIGAALGPVFTTCSPTYFLILATILPRSLSAGFLDLVAYAIGLSCALFIIAILGQKIVGAVGVASDPKGWFKKVLGVIFIIIGLAIIFGYDQKLEASLVSGGIFDVTHIEDTLLEHSGTSATSTTTDAPYTATLASPSTTATSTPEAKPTTPKVVYLTLAQKAAKYSLAPEITNPSGFINTPSTSSGQAGPISISQFKGKKVVLVDFWTYSCINCQRTLPYLEAWYDKYNNAGLEIISIHTPEFAFEKVQSNVQAAVTRLGIKYPVVMDNNYGTWNAFGNEYWPHKYLIDIDGYIVYDHIGEGNYGETEQAIQAALGERDARVDPTATVPIGLVNPKSAVTVDNSELGSPETYFGSNRNQYLANGTQMTAGTQTLTLPSAFKPNELNLGGTWNFQPEYAEATGPADIVFVYQAKNVYFVASSAAGATITVTEDGQPLGGSAGSDIDPSTSIAMIKDNRLYTLVQNKDYETHTLKIHINSGTLDAYTFTFG